MKEMTSVAQTVVTDEEREELEKEGIIPPSTPAQEKVPTRPTTPAAEPRVSGQAAKYLDTSAVALKASASCEDTSKRTLSPDSSPSKNGSKSAPASPSLEKDKDLHTSKKRSKLTPEQRMKLQELEEERKKALEERVKILTTKLVERLRPFIEAKHPGEKDDPETRTFQDKMKLEAEDLKLESFGVEVGQCLFASGYMDSVHGDRDLVASCHWHRLQYESLFVLEVKEIPWAVSRCDVVLPQSSQHSSAGFWSRIKEKGSVAKDAWGVIGSA